MSGSRRQNEGVIRHVYRGVKERHEQQDDRGNGQQFTGRPRNERRCESEYRDASRDERKQIATKYHFKGTRQREIRSINDLRLAQKNAAAAGPTTPAK